MPRSKHQLSTEYPYHVSARCLNKEWFGLEHKELWDLFSDYLYFLHHAFDIRIHSFVLMSNHFHLLISTPRGNLSEAMAYFMTQTSKYIGDRTDRLNQVYGRRYFRNLIRTDHHFEHVYKYVYRNPVEAGMVERVEQYQWSSLAGLIGASHILIPLEEDNILIPDLVGTLKWLNTSYKENHRELIKAALRKSEFKFRMKTINGVQLNHELERMRS